jgi:hypothetical protein
VLSQPVAILDIADAEAFCCAAANRTLKRWRMRICSDDHDDLVSHLLGELWRLSLNHDPAVQSLSKRAYTVLQFRVTDWARQRWPGSRWDQEAAHSVLSLDAGAPGTGDAGLGDTVAAGPMDSEAHWLTDLVRELDERGGEEPRAVTEARRRAAETAARRDRTERAERLGVQFAERLTSGESATDLAREHGLGNARIVVRAAERALERI